MAANFFIKAHNLHKIYIKTFTTPKIRKFGSYVGTFMGLIYFIDHYDDLDKKNELKKKLPKEKKIDNNSSINFGFHVGLFNLFSFSKIEIIEKKALNSEPEPEPEPKKEKQYLFPYKYLITQHMQPAFNFLTCVIGSGIIGYTIATYYPFMIFYVVVDNIIYPNDNEDTTNINDNNENNKIN